MVLVPASLEIWCQEFQPILTRGDLEALIVQTASLSSVRAQI